MLLRNTDEIRGIFRELRGLRVRISIDDFGMGYSSLSYLRSFPLDRIKIDRSFIRDVSRSDAAAAIVQAITGLSTALDRC
jgi:EAL domain-containing protein (putative c-di-GMP-specific phosphodiesterase class I)